MLEYIDQIKDLTDSEKNLFSNEMKNNSKSILAGQMACLFLGGFGGHRFYLNENKVGLFYLIGIPLLFIISISKDWVLIYTLIIIFYLVGLLVEVLMMRGRVKKYNFKLASDISQKIKSIRTK